VLTVTAHSVIAPGNFRQVMGHLPTGVVAVTATDPSSAPIGMAVGSFVSASLDPPLVAFLPDKSSRTFPRIRERGRFCANVLGAGQEDVCRALASKTIDKFEGISWRPSARTGSPLIDNVLAWIDCEIIDVTDAGDHYFVLARVLELEAVSDTPPLVFFQGGYGEFAVPSLAAPATPELLRALRIVDLARPSMQALADEFGGECLASVVVNEHIEVVGSAGRVGSRIGQRSPFMAPLGAGAAGWADEATQRRWMGGDLSEEQAGACRSMLGRVRSRGWSVVVDNEPQRALEAAVARAAGSGVHPHGHDAVACAASSLDFADYEPADMQWALARGLRSISAPVFEQSGEVAIQLSLYGFQSADQTWFDGVCAQMLGAAAEVSSMLSRRDATRSSERST
jgi:flavin reductase (DIM6/NTAB) family NADH-FMN oxidoreductase RutF/DNA-binding IclR family transcriptional regulator